MKQYGKSWYETFMGDLHTLGVAVTRVSPNEMYEQPAKEEAMKVQLRVKSTSCTEWEVVDEAKAYYIVKDHAGYLRVLDKADYEPVEEFEDVSNIYNGDEAMGVLHSSLYKLTRHEVSKLNKQMKAYAYLLEREKA